MSKFYFFIDPFALALVAFVLPLLYYFWRRLKAKNSFPSLLYSDLSLISSVFSVKKTLSPFPQILKTVSLGLLLVAFIDPHLQVARSGTATQPREGIAIYLILDRSSSMNSKVNALLDEGRQLSSIPKIELLKKITKAFIAGDPALHLEGRSNDLIGLVEFARTAQVVDPLTFDHARILSDLDKLAVVTNKDEDGTTIGYAIYKTASLIAATRHYAEELNKGQRPAYEIKNSIAILVTDGFHSPNPLDSDNPLRSMEPMQAAQFAAQNHVRIYIINIEPALSSEEFGPQRRLMERMAAASGGKYFLMDEATSLNKIYEEIDKLEKSTLPDLGGETSEMRPDLFKRISFYPYLISVALFCLFAALILETTWLRSMP